MEHVSWAFEAVDALLTLLVIFGVPAILLLGRKR